MTHPSSDAPTTWVEGAAGSLFDLDNLPYGVFSLRGQEGGGDAPRVCVRIGDHVLDLAPVAEIGDPASELAAAWRTPSLNAFMAMGAGAAIFAPIIYAVMGFIIGVIGAFIYNLVAKWVGGIEVEVE